MREQDEQALIDEELSPHRFEAREVGSHWCRHCEYHEDFAPAHPPTDAPPTLERQQRYDACADELAAALSQGTEP